MERMADDIPIIDDCMYIPTWFPVDHYLALLDRVLIVLASPVAKLGCEDVENLSPSPALLAVRVVGVVVWGHATEAIFKEVGPGPRVTGGYGNGRWRGKFWVRGGEWERVHVEGCRSQSHAGARIATSARQIGEDARGGRQGCKTVQVWCPGFEW